MRRRIIFFSGRWIMRCESHTHPRSRLSMICSVFFSMLLVAVFTGCDRAPAPAEEGKPKRSSDHARLVRLPVDEVTRSGVTLGPVERTAFRTYRTFPGVVRPNENALANITTL